MRVLRHVLKFFIYLIFFIVYFFLTGLRLVLAQDEFQTRCFITYSVNSDAKVEVIQNITLTNKFPNIYATHYQLSFGTTQITNIWAKDDFGNINPLVEKKENSTQITINFNEKVLGKGKEIHLTLGYTSADYANKNGRILEITIPKIVQAEQFEEYQVSLIVPNIFEDLAFILPQPSQINTANDKKIIFFTKEKVVNQSITAAFGNYQIFDFQLKYHLSNPYPSKAKTEISLPPDTPFQKVYYYLINPLPKNIIVDDDGNWLAEFELEKKQNLEIIASGSAKVFIKPQKDFPIFPVVNLQDYLKEQKYWEVNHPQIKNLASKLKTPEAIYQYVVKNLIYDYQKVNQNSQRQGALATLGNPASAICMDFTDLFIALARAAGIPSREVNGYAYTNNPQLKPLSLRQDILHSWPQYYDSQQKIWINVDPTWENTSGGIDFFNKLDFNHFAFTFHGKESDYPLTPGSYKQTNFETKDIQISFGKEPFANENLEVKISFPQRIIAGFPIKGKVSVYNKGNTAVYQRLLSVSLENSPNISQQFFIQQLPPFAFWEKEITLGKTEIFEKNIKNILINLGKQQYRHQIKIQPLLPSPLNFLGEKLFLFIQKLIKMIK